MNKIIIFIIVILLLYLFVKDMFDFDSYLLDELNKENITIAIRQL
jgi:hypothetical protein